MGDGEMGEWETGRWGDWGTGRQGDRVVEKKDYGVLESWSDGGKQKLKNGTSNNQPHKGKELEEQQ